MSDEKTIVTVEIAGDEYTLRSEASPEYARECAAHVDDVISEIVARGSLIEGHKAAMLAALALTDELFQLRAEMDALRDEVARQAGSLAAEMEDAIAAEDLAPSP